ncbi:hypothetical protein VIGAN_09128700 [Vigna angularis var. angularis]|uniref:Uncharacterized protein n=1 Tax=Vigna angularis var. angularis TaxID=157739 RepID=A0A0S3SXV2_PHAAN|nr:hypothetical protein VIGAN_09128700 [Vigna angularis var. angularis]
MEARGSHGWKQQHFTAASFIHTSWQQGGPATHPPTFTRSSKCSEVAAMGGQHNHVHNPEKNTARNISRLAFTQLHPAGCCFQQRSFTV